MQAPSSQAPALAPAAPRAAPAPNATAVWRAARSSRDELKNQLENLEEKRSSLSEQVTDGRVTGASKVGTEARIVDIDKQISLVDKQIAAAEGDVARAAAIPGAVQVEPPRGRSGPPEEVFVLGGMFIFACILPISIALARRIWRRGKDAIVSFPQELTERLNRLDHAVDSIAVEVERIGEGQRFVTRVMTDTANRGLGAGAAQPIDVGARDKARVGREGL